MVQSINSTQKIEETDGLPMPKRIWAVVSVGFALCMSVLDINIVNIVLPTLSHDFGTSPAVTTWIINGYQLAIVISLLSFSALGEIIGYRKVFLSGIGLFCITSLICALSDSFWTLTVARIFQGFSASAITSVNTAQLRYIYPKSQIGRGMGINAMVVAISAAAGPSVASGILSIASWHWLFAINVPLGLTALFLGIKHLESRFRIPFWKEYFIACHDTEVLPPGKIGHAILYEEIIGIGLSLRESQSGPCAYLLVRWGYFSHRP